MYREEKAELKDVDLILDFKLSLPNGIFAII